MALDQSDAADSSSYAEIGGEQEPAAQGEDAQPSLSPASGEDEGNATAVIYAVASQPDAETIGVCVEGIDGMFILTNVGDPEDFIQEETP